mmetsp:Transcript_81279/g.180838  ORF Transcript_81279/g.180838 Transcript_81279/m.180838 type:complete len:223 (+) Transcript_81279:238-906(+)
MRSPGCQPLASRVAPPSLATGARGRRARPRRLHCRQLPPVLRGAEMRASRRNPPPMPSQQYVQHCAFGLCLHHQAPRRGRCRCHRWHSPSAMGAGPVPMEPAPAPLTPKASCTSSASSLAAPAHLRQAAATTASSPANRSPGSRAPPGPPLEWTAPRSSPRPHHSPRATSTTSIRQQTRQEKGRNKTRRPHLTPNLPCSPGTSPRSSTPAGTAGTSPRPTRN